MNYFKLIKLLLAVTLVEVITSSCSKSEAPIRFAIASDFHAPDVPDGKKRVETFIKAANDENADFIIELGDFAGLTVQVRCTEIHGTVLKEKNTMSLEIMTLTVIAQKNM